MVSFYYYIYYNKLDKPVNINDIILHPFLNDNKIIWEYENPNDVSFSTDIIEGHLQELLHDFLSSIGIQRNDWKLLTQNYCSIASSDVYVNKELRNKINNITDNLNGIVLNDEEDSLNADVFVKGWSIEYPEDDMLYFHLHIPICPYNTVPIEVIQFYY